MNSSRSQLDFSSTNSNNIFELKTIRELVNVLRGTSKLDTFDTIERVLFNRDIKLRTDNLDLQEQLQKEVCKRRQAEEEVKKREEFCEKAKRVEESYETLLKENNELECEVKKLKEKCVDDGNELDDIRRKNAELVEDANELGVLRKMVGDLEDKVLELIKLNDKLVEDNIALDELRGKVRVLEGDRDAVVARLTIQIGELEESVKNHLATISELKEENCKLKDENLKIETLYKSLCTNQRELQERLLKYSEHTKLLMNFIAFFGGNNEREPHADSMVADVFRHDTVEAAPLRRNEDVHDSLGVAASTQPQNIGGNDTQGASSAIGRVKSGKDSEIPILDDDDHQSISQRIHGKKTIFGPSVKDAHPSSSVATQRKSKFANATIDADKRKFSFPNIVSSSTSDDSFMDNLPISSAVSQRKKAKM